jgi:GAF domain-containing protein
MLHRELAELGASLSPESDLHAGLHRLTVTAAGALEVAGAGVTLQIPGGSINYITAADPVTLHVERRQDELNEGACVDAITSSEVVTVSDLTIEPRWPRFTPVLLDAGFRAAAGVPILFQNRGIGAINLYDRKSRPWTVDDFAAARLVAQMAAGYLVNNELLRTTQTLAQQLQFALDSRIIIEQAKGKLAERFGMEPDAAFEVLRAHARDRRRKLHDLALDVVNNAVDLADESPDGPRKGANG